jgi:small subunit ribosomal protein S6
MKRARDQKEVQTAMNKYELALVVNAKIEDDARVATVEKAKEYVTKFGGNITNVEEWGKKKLAYKINGEDFAVYVAMDVKLPAAAPAKISNTLNITDEVLRYLLVKAEERAEVAEEAEEK